MGSRPFDLGAGRNGPGQGRLVGQGAVKAAAPYRVDMADEEFVAVGDVVVCTLAPSRERTAGGIELPDAPSPFHLVLDVGPKVQEVAGLILEAGDTIAMEGAAFADTLAGRVWFVRAEKVLAVVKRKAVAAVGAELEADPWGPAFRLPLAPHSDPDPPTETPRNDVPGPASLIEPEPAA